MLDDFVTDETARLGLEPEPHECIAVMSRLARAVQILMQATVDTFIARYTDTIQEQTERLRSFKPDSDARAL